MNDNLASLMVVAILNIVVIICFTLLAINFNHWWIVLFSILCMFKYRAPEAKTYEESENVDEQSD